MVFEAITALLLAYQTTAPEFRHNSLYTFNVDPKSSEIVIMNTQTGHIYRCGTEEECNERLEYYDGPSHYQSKQYQETQYNWSKHYIEEKEKK